MQHDEEEPQRFLGFPVARRQDDGGPGPAGNSVRGGHRGTGPRVLGIPTSGWRLARDDTRPRVMGIPRVEYTGKPLDLRWVRSPIRWFRWRREVSRRGPYAPSFDDFR